ncbi:hypothetical protein [Viridibacterium curvum]|uniref:Uncharacterized protein n=1 Tax=Viridibacterium curvum TaxID=1101404 RepID=A0ABP9R5N7_9RHOO
MNMKTVNFGDASADANAAYVKLDDVKPLVDALEKLIWQVHYGKFIDASAAATAATNLLATLRTPQAA